MDTLLLEQSITALYYLCTTNVLYYHHLIPRFFSIIISVKTADPCMVRPTYMHDNTFAGTHRIHKRKACKLEAQLISIAEFI